MIEFEEGVIATLTLNNPERHNALTHEDFAQFHRILDELDSSVTRVLLLNATGKSFCAGVEFNSLQTGNWAHENPLNQLCERVSRLPMPTIAALNGHFVGGGAELAFSCDMRVAVPHAKCRIPAAGIAVHYEPSGIARVAAVVGLQMARRLFLGFEVFEGEALLAHGFVDHIAEDSLAFAQDYAERMSKLSPMALQGMKQSLNAIRDGVKDDARARIEAAFASKDFAEAMRAIKDKRAPNFKGR